MATATVGKWGKSLAVRVPHEVAKRAGLEEGEHVEVEAVAGEIVIRRAAAQAEAVARSKAAAEAIAVESRRHSLGGVRIRELLDEGRRR